MNLFFFWASLELCNIGYIMLLSVFKIGLLFRCIQFTQCHNGMIRHPRELYIDLENCTSRNQSKATAVGATSSNICRKALTPSMNLGTYPNFTNGR